MLLKLLKNLKSKIVISGDLFYMTNGANALPDKLSSEEELKVLNDLKNGSEEAKTILIEKNLRLVVYLAQKFENTGRVR